MSATFETTVLLCLFLTLAGCSNKVETTGDGWINIGNGEGSASIKEITLPSGQKCVAMVGLYKAALTCDWTPR